MANTAGTERRFTLPSRVHSKATSRFFLSAGRRRLTDDVLVVLRDELLPVALIRGGEVDVDEAVARRVQVGLEGEHRLLVGHVLILGVEVVDELHPRQKP